MEEIWNWEDRKLWNCNGERKMEKICRCASQDLCIWSVWGIWLNRIFFPETTNFPSHVRNMSWVSMVRYIHFLVKLTCFPGASKHLIWYIGNFKHFGHSKYVHSKIKRYVSKMTLHTFELLHQIKIMHINPWFWRFSLFCSEPVNHLYFLLLLYSIVYST